jgi:predicted RecB family nuclease
MRKTSTSLELTATDLVGFLNCRHLSYLDLAVAEGALPKPFVWDPMLEILSERGSAHEEAYVQHLILAGRDVARIDRVGTFAEAEDQTLAAMQSGRSVIVQGALSHDEWGGRPDILRRVEAPSTLGSWSYEAMDTKLSRETKAGTILQLCLYSDLLREAQGVAPEFMYVVPPWTDFKPQPYRFADFAAYFRKAKRALRRALTDGSGEDTYPEPTAHCDICRWRIACDGRRRNDDHLSLVAWITKTQINELRERGISTVKSLASLPLPLEWKPERGSAESYERVREQARLQVEARQCGAPLFELLPVETGFGLTCLPEPSAGDVFLDFEGDPFVGEYGLEYLIGYQFRNPAGEWTYTSDWAFTRQNERLAFETFVDFIMARWQQHPGMHIYHYAPYEPAALKRLMGRYATRQEEIDQMLRAKLFVDLFSVVRHSVRASVESYSIKRLELFYGLERQAALPDANVALANLQASLELDDTPSIPEDIKSIVRAYNEDDCRSTLYLRDWLEELRGQVVNAGTEVPRPDLGNGTTSENITDWIIKIRALADRLTVGVPDDRAIRNEEQQGRWILANILDWHRRELNAALWEYFRLSDLSADELRDERAGLSGLKLVGVVGGKPKTPIHRYSFLPQETELRGGEEIKSLGGASFGTLEAISFVDSMIDIKKRKDTAAVHPEAVFAHKVVRCPEQQNALVRIGEYVAEHGLYGDGPYQAARDLLLRAPPRLNGEPIRKLEETTLGAAVRLSGHLAGGIIPIQGPPGAGKTHTGARIICELVRQGKTVGIAANSHKVIRNLIDKTIEIADELGVGLHCCHKADEYGSPQHRLTFAKSNEALFQGLGQDTNVGGGTAFLWSRQDAFEAVDVLFVDEAAQMSLANVLAVSQAAKAVVLIGDPQQLDQPMQGSHPDGTGVSALAHILGGEQTVPTDRGLFLAETWRLHPSICEFTSEVFYAGKLKPKTGLERQVIRGSVSGSGLRYISVAHTGNQNCSPEEAVAISDIVQSMLASGATWVDAEGEEKPLTLHDIMVITPYNAQVFEIQQRLPGARVGTVDKFQGQEAPIAIYSTATSSHADAPRGMEFLYSLNRLNVATSRARCLSILVSSPQLFEAECRTPRQIQLANAFCRFLEMAEPILAPSLAVGGV